MTGQPEAPDPWRGFCPVFTIRGAHSTLPRVVVDVEPVVDTIFELADFYSGEIGFGDRSWLEARLRSAGAPHGLAWAEALDAWETEPGVTGALLPAEEALEQGHPSRPGPISEGG